MLDEASFDFSSSLTSELRFHSLSLRAHRFSPIHSCVPSSSSFSSSSFSSPVSSAITVLAAPTTSKKELFQAHALPLTRTVVPPTLWRHSLSKLCLCYAVTTHRGQFHASASSSRPSDPTRLRPPPAQQQRRRRRVWRSCAAAHP